MSVAVELADFFEAHPEANAVEVFRKLKEKKAHAGQILYYIKFMNDPSFELFRSVPVEVKSEELKKWLGVEQKDLKLEYVKRCEEWFIDNWLDPTARLMTTITKKVFQADKVMRDYSVDSPEKFGELSDMLDSFEKIKQKHDKCLQLFKSGESVKQKHGGGQVSPASTGKLFDGIE